MFSNRRTVRPASSSDGPIVVASAAMSSIACVPASNEPDTAVRLPASASTASTDDPSTSSARSMVSSIASSDCKVTSRVSSDAVANCPTKIHPTIVPDTAISIPATPTPTMT